MAWQYDHVGLWACQGGPVTGFQHVHVPILCVCVCVCVSKREVGVMGRSRWLGPDSALLGEREWARETGEPTF